jgi:predicted membrane protein
MTISKRVKQIYISFLVSVFFAGFHSLLNLILDRQEWISLIFVALSLIIFVLAITYSTMEFVVTKEPTDLWKVGFLGIFGLIGLLPGIGYGFFGLFALFSFFGTRQYF